MADKPEDRNEESLNQAEIDRGESAVAKEINANARRGLRKVELWNKQAHEDFAFALGEQWTEEERAVLAEEKRPCLTFNKIQPLLDLVSGYQRDNSSRIKVHPEGGEDQVFSKIADRILVAVDKWSKLEYKMNLMFDQGIYCGKDFLEMAVKYDTDPINGDLVFRNNGPFLIIVDPDSVEYDMSDAGWLVKVSRLTKSRLKDLYPKKKTLIDGLKEDTDDIFVNLDVLKEGDKDNYHLGREDEFESEEDAALDDPDRTGSAQLFTLKEQWKKKSVVRWFVYDIIEDVVEKFEQQHDAEAKKQEILGRIKQQHDAAMAMYQAAVAVNPAAANTMPMPQQEEIEIQVFERTVDETYYAAACCGFTMEDEIISPFAPSYTGFPIFRFMAKYMPAAKKEVLRVKGIVRDLKDPNREINKARSQFLHILNTAANSGWIGDKDALADDDDKKLLETMGSKPGICIWKKPNSDLRKIEPSMPPTGQLSRGEIADQDIKEISGINPDALAIQDKTTSGKAIALRIKQAVTILARIFSNFRYTKELIGTAIFNMIPNVFDAKKIAKVVGEEFMKSNQVDMGYLRAFLTRIKDGKFDVKVTEADNSTTVRIETFEQLMSMAEAGYPIPPDLLIEFSNMPDSAEVIKKINAYAQAQAQAQKAAPGAAGK